MSRDLGPIMDAGIGGRARGRASLGHSRGDCLGDRRSAGHDLSDSVRIEGSLHELSRPEALA